MHAHRLGHAERGEDLVKHGHDDRAAPDAEQPGEHAGDDPGRRQRENEQDEFAERNAGHEDLEWRGGWSGRDVAHIAPAVH